MQGLLFVNFYHQLNWEFVLFIPAPPIVTVSCRTNFQSTMKICFESSDSSYTLNPTYLEHQPTCEDVTTTQDPRTNGFSRGNISEAKSGHKRRVFLRSNGCTIEQSSGPVYTKCQQQCCNNSAMTQAILFSLKEMVSLQNGLATHFRAASLFSMRTVLVASLQSCYGVDAGAWCKWALNRVFCSHWANSSFRLMQVSSRCHSPFLFDKLGIEKRNFLQCAWTWTWIRVWLQKRRRARRPRRTVMTSDTLSSTGTLAWWWLTLCGTGGPAAKCSKTGLSPPTSW